MNTQKKNIVEIYTDGACSGNPGRGGWGALLRYGHTEKQLYGGEQNTTNNRMEMTAAIEALSVLKRPCKVKLWTDSQYLRKGVTEWLANWIKQNWRTAAKKPVKNQDLWEKLVLVMNSHEIEWHWVKGHSGHPENELADELANRGMEQIK